MQDSADPPWSKFREITERFSGVKYMTEAQAAILRDLIVAEDAQDILEIGFFHGKSSTYIAAILEDLGRGSLVTIDRRSAAKRSPAIHDLLAASGLGHRVQPLFAFRSFTWELRKLITKEPRPRFDLCYFDGGHTWDDTGFGVVLVDMLLRPGGLLILDDLNWRAKSSTFYKTRPNRLAKFSPDEAAARMVRLVSELILPHLGYTDMREFPEVGWGVARKPGAGAAAAARAVEAEPVGS